ncbi:MAG TPA: hypothetical protein VFN26_24580 [Candidatus Acidoferrum sp.]|nr:hypothetical protein [Candidatus Acidoferrum sp.]
MVKIFKGACLLLFLIPFSPTTSSSAHPKSPKPTQDQATTDSAANKNTAKPTKLDAGPQNPDSGKAPAEKAPKSSPGADPSEKRSKTPLLSAASSATTVWVNTDSGIYHKPGSRYYGKTKKGKYMTEAEARKAGYREAKKE